MLFRRLRTKRSIAVVFVSLVALLASGTAAASALGRDDGSLDDVYSKQTGKAGGNWFSFVTDGNGQAVIDDEANTEVEAWSVNKLAVATAVLDKVDRGDISLDQKLTLTEDIIAEGSGSYLLQGTYGDQLTVANLLTNMLQVSDNTAVRMLGQLVSGTEINAVMASKGFEKTRVEPLADNPIRFFLGKTTPRENNRLLSDLAGGRLLSPESTELMLKIMRWTSVGYTDGVRHDLNSAERDQTAVKYGSGDATRNETGIVFAADGKPAFVYSLFNVDIPAEQAGQQNGALVAQAKFGRAMLDEVNDDAPSTTTTTAAS